MIDVNAMAKTITPFLITSVANNAVVPKEGKDCIIIIGDSRSCGLLVHIDANPMYKRKYYYHEGIIYDGIVEGDDVIIAVFAESGGNYYMGSMKKSIDRFMKAFKSYSEIHNAKSYKVFNLYGYNDIAVAVKTNIPWPKKYVKADEAFKKQLGDKCTMFYQFNAGPVNEDGFHCIVDGFQNSTIEEYNKDFIPTKDINVFDLFGYLQNKGLGPIEDAPENSGIHYSLKTNQDIFDVILHLAKE